MGVCDWDHVNNAESNCTEVPGTIGAELFGRYLPSQIHCDTLFLTSDAAAGDNDVYSGPLGGSIDVLAIASVNTLREEVHFTVRGPRVYFTRETNQYNIYVADWDGVDATNIVSIDATAEFSVSINTSGNEDVGDVDTEGVLWGGRMINNKWQVFHVH